MARLSGKNGRIYFAVASGAEASPIPFYSDWEINHNTDKIDVTSMGDAMKTYVSGMAEASGSFSGFYDDETAQTYTAATDGLARKWYLYPSTLSNSKYFFGTVIADWSASSSVSGAITTNASWNAATVINKVTS